MRIRKRFPLSSLYSFPLSDPQLNRSPLVQQQEGNNSSQPSDPTNQPPPPSSDQTLDGRTRWVSSDGSNKSHEEREHRERREEGQKSNDTRKESIIGAEVGSGFLPTTGSFHPEGGKGYEGDRVVPLKKRMGSFERRGDEKGTMEKDKKMKSKMKSKTNKKCFQKHGDHDEQEGKEVAKEGNGNPSNGERKIKRGNVIMEGSRCSRVNGRGWRCCQQTLVGYSLCEHHLGKGRLRSMNSSAIKKADFANLSNSSTLVQGKELRQGFEDEDDEKKPLVKAKKRMKIGVVKARSISSLLGQTNNVVLVADDNKNTGV